MDSATGYSEASERNRTAGLPLSHLSIEVGHFYMDDLINGADRIRAQLRQVAPLVAAHAEAARAQYGPTARVSTCFLVDDYFRHDTDPTEILDKLLGAAEECGVRIDYLAREAGCWEVPVFIDGERSGDPIPLAEMVANRIVAEPDRETNGRRPPTAESGWLCNGRRSSDTASGQAMRVEPYRPPEEFGHRNHSIFLDVELWSRREETVAGATEVHTTWSCPFLASIWQLLRLGMLRWNGGLVAAPEPWQPADGWPDNWWKMPAVTQLNPAAAPFAAYRSLSILPHTYLGIEHAVRVILDHLEQDEEVQALLTERGAAERIPVTIPPVTRRLTHVFLGE
ncbi:SCO2522 family protein [Nocardia sp. NPDC050406]|uniref:SCO2522 family protein n=1 Tax=Nocardia sp. NPDC050406 TaxID=3364318 RepID=UPI0037B6E836